jgi:DNA-binding FadR family transcriptional regulator
MTIDSYPIPCYTQERMENVKLVESAAEALSSYIKDLAPGDKLPNEHQLAGLLGVGRSTVREAVKVLAAQKALDVRQGAGTFVLQPRPAGVEDILGIGSVADKEKLLMDLLEVRLALEPRIAALAATWADAEDVAEMRFQCAEVERLIREDRDYTRHDIALHKKIAESSRNLVVVNLVPVIQNAVMLFIIATHRVLKEETVRTHRLIVDAIEAHDPLAASDAMTMHILYNRNSIENLAGNKNSAPGGR